MRTLQIIPTCHLKAQTTAAALGLVAFGLTGCPDNTDLGNIPETGTDGSEDGSSSDEVDTSGEGTDEASTTGTDTGTGTGTGTDTDTDTGPEGAQIHIHVRANGDSFDHADAFAGQTPQDYFYGIRSLTLYRTPGDPDPMLVFDHGAEFVEASYAPGADTVVASVLAAELEADLFTYARVTVSHVRLRIDATMHAVNLDVPGAFDIIHVLGDETTYDGEVHDQGWWRYVFDAGGMQFPLEGEGGGPGVGAPLGAPIEVVEEGPETALYFAVNLPVVPQIVEDIDIVMDFNVDRCFRWQDEAGVGYLDEVFDTTPVSPELITRMGVNDSSIYFE